ncbi:MFS transporter [Terrilactibacillus sp. BCM23-1]|uniref:MFS transporter n=1 Tax=Terrilactibacillus tamarindi TaxID=2599694 RepID=A0A6N8CMI0_9BACI|nr:MFS transporter [Terrilactibacillus tamarindi]MTT31121.1 MFS transporter [Terrilactibacillus tamarindi]
MNELLKNRSFCLIWLAQIVSRFGDAITITIIFYVLGSSSNNPFIISLALFAQVTPSVIFGVFMGSLSDVCSKKWIMITSNIFSLCMVTLMIFFLDKLLILLLLIFAEGICSAAFYPARTSYISDIVGDKMIPNAIAISQSTYSILLIVGPAITGILIPFFPISHILIIDAITFLISSILIFYTSTKKESSSNKKFGLKVSFFSSIKNGFVTVYKISVLKLLIVYMIPVMLSIGVLNTVYNSLILQTFKVHGLIYGISEGLFGGGAVIGSILGSYLLKKISPSRLLIYNIILLGIWMIFAYPLLFLFQLIGIIPVLIWVLIIGLTSALLNIPTITLFLKLAPKEYRGRAISFLQTISNFGLIIGAILGGFISLFIGLVSTLAIFGIIIAIISLLVLNIKIFKPLTTIKTVNEGNVRSPKQI